MILPTFDTFVFTDAAVVALEEDVPRGRKWRVRRRFRLPATVPTTAAATRTAAPSARLRSLVQAGDSIRHGGTISFFPYFALARMVHQLLFKNNVTDLYNLKHKRKIN